MNLLLFVSPRARIYYNAELLYFRNSSPPIFPTEDSCISVGFVSTFCLKRGLTVGAQVGAVGAQHFPAGAGMWISPGWWVSWL